MKNGKHPTKEAALICRKCGGKRHLERDCRKGSKGPSPNKTTTKSTYPKKNMDKGKKGRVHLTNANEEDYGEDQEDAINGMMQYGYCRQSYGQMETEDSEDDDMPSLCSNSDTSDSEDENEEPVAEVTILSAAFPVPGGDDDDSDSDYIPNNDPDADMPDLESDTDDDTDEDPPDLENLQQKKGRYILTVRPD